MKEKEDANNHNCEKCLGKIRHIETSDNKVFCVRCKRELLYTQIHEKAINLLNRGRR